MPVLLGTGVVLLCAVYFAAIVLGVVLAGYVLYLVMRFMRGLFGQENEA